jgi:hypothetical protein
VLQAAMKVKEIEISSFREMDPDVAVSCKRPVA